MKRKEIRHLHHLALIVRSGSHRAKTVVVGIVHCYNYVKPVEIRLLYLTRTVGKIQSPALRMHTHAGVGKITGMSAVESGGVDLKPVGHTFFIYNPLHNAMRSRTAAYVAEADEKKPCFSIIA